MAATEGSPLTPLFVELNKYAQTGEFEKAQKVANKILTHPNGGYTNQKAIQCKLVCLIQLSKFPEAIEFISRNAENISADISFEKAYCLYRLNQTQEALDILDAEPSEEFRVRELKAQILYRLERYRECYDLYRDMMKNSGDEYEIERLTNLGACMAALTFQEGVIKAAPKLPEDTYELAYNKATTLLAQGQHAKALDLLKKAEDMCRETLKEEEATEDEVNDEVSLLLAQIGYANQKMGIPEAASKYYNQVLRNKPSDLAVVAVASNNIISLNKEQNIFDSKKKIKACIVEGIENKLTRMQRKSIALNNVLLHYHGHSSSETCWKLMKYLEALSSPDDASLVLLKAALFTVDKQVPKACNVLNEFAKSHKEQSVATSLACAQLYLSIKQVDKAVQVLEGLGDTSFTPGILSALISLCRSLNDDERASQIFKRAIAYHKKSNPKSELLQQLIRKSAQYFLRLGKQQEAAALLQEQRKTDPKNPKLLAQLVAAYSTFDTNKAKEVAQDLPSVDDIVSSVDASVLEATNWVMGTRHVRKVVASPATKESAKSEETKKNKKKKKGKMPKNYDPNVAPDPERWLPKWERSTFKKRGGRKAREAQIGKGSQGAVGNTAELDASNRPTLVVQPTLPSPAGVGPRGQRPKVQQKKKKKGNKW